MSAEQKKRTRKEVDLLREGYFTARMLDGGARDRAREEAARAFPYLKRTVPNVVMVGGLIEVMLNDGRIWHRVRADWPWTMWVNEEATAAYAKLFAQPTIEVEDDGTEQDAA